MKLTSIVIAAGLLAAPAIAFAQSSPSPNNQSGPGVSPTAPAPTDQGIGSESSNTRGVPSRGSMGSSAGGSMGITGNAATSGSTPRMENRNASPASPGEGVKKEQ